MAQYSRIRERFLAIVQPSRPNEWDVDEVVQVLGNLDDEDCEILLQSVAAIWPVSHSLSFSFLLSGAEILAQLDRTLLPEWVRWMLALYEQKGLVGAREFMADVEGQFLAPLRGQASVDFDAVAPLLTKYIRGVSGRALELQTAQQPGTNTRVIFLPPRVDLFQEQAANFIIYKLLVSLQWAQIGLRSYEEMADGCVLLDEIFATFPDAGLATDLFGIFMFRRAFSFLRQQLPGLVRQAMPLCEELIGGLRTAADGNPGQMVLQNIFLEDLAETGSDRAAHLDRDTVISEIARRYEKLANLSGAADLGCCRLLVGGFDLGEAEREISRRRQEQQEKFIALLALLKENSSEQGEEDAEGRQGSDDSEEALAAMLMLAADVGRIHDEKISLANEKLEISSELRQLIRDIVDDLGQLPVSYVQAAAGVGGPALNLAPPGVEGEENGYGTNEEVHIYDEWDFRRGGYRSNWCRLMERQLYPVRSTFVADTLLKYQAELTRLRRQFEMLRTHSCFVRRQRFGDDIDLDAVVDALGDRHAGLPPSERLFVRLLRDRRDIGAMFLVDMSNSTEGWVGVAIKEALILLAEALELVGDRYAIYGFSGMRRSRNDLYCVKGLEEYYDQLVQQRISAIVPMEYTRMGPPIRHLTEKLLAIQSRVRLLIVISDGKPEDYDDYKGEYAIEDTRKALAEARGRGIYPFCITIDRNAHEYLDHMFGGGNYIFVNEVAKLPHRMTEMYRLLTS